MKRTYFLLEVRTIMMIGKFCVIECILKYILSIISYIVTFCLGIFIFTVYVLYKMVLDVLGKKMFLFVFGNYAQKI